MVEIFIKSDFIDNKFRILIIKDSIAYYLDKDGVFKSNRDFIKCNPEIYNGYREAVSVLKKFYPQVKKIPLRSVPTRTLFVGEINDQENAIQL